MHPDARFSSKACIRTPGDAPDYVYQGVATIVIVTVVAIRDSFKPRAD